MYTSGDYTVFEFNNRMVKNSKKYDAITRILAEHRYYRFKQDKLTLNDYEKHLNNRFMLLESLLRYYESLSYYRKSGYCPQPHTQLIKTAKENKESFTENIGVKFYGNVRNDEVFFRLSKCFSVDDYLEKSYGLTADDCFLSINNGFIRDIGRYVTESFIYNIRSKEQLNNYMNVVDFFKEYFNINILESFDHTKFPKDNYPLSLSTKKMLDDYMEVVNFFQEKFGTNLPEHNLGRDVPYNKWIETQLNILNITTKDIDLANFDLKNAEDIKHCKKLYPLAVKYPDLFWKWYNRATGKIKFEPTYENGLEKKRKEVHAKIEDKKAKTKSTLKRVILKFAAKVVVPEKLGKTATKMEQKIADIAYRKKQKGRK
ncbi:MAG: hypothetical protein IKP35_00230 [Alphaproteobacteria bacterium]|nr:hypothetical protein [Alphaproteobacteria bacterium]